MEKENKKRGFEVIEPPIHNDLDWDYELILKCMEIFKEILENRINDLPNSAKFYLIAMTDKFGGKYPAIGLSADTEDELKLLPDLFKLDEIVTKIYKEELPITLLKEKAENIDTITWEKLKKIGFYRK